MDRGFGMMYVHTPHIHRRHAPKTIAEHHGSGLNARIAVFITKNVGTMWCAYVFAIVGICGIVGALTSNTELVLLVGAVSGYFLQLVLLPVIIVGQNVQAEASDARAKATYEDAEAVLHECLELQKHLQAQDELLSTITRSPKMRAN
jgi:hypothetical protein